MHCLTWSLPFLASFAPLVAGRGVLRPPSVPLVVHDPGFSVWSSADKLTDCWPAQSTGRTQALSCLARVDGKVMRVIGTAPTSVPAMEQVGVEVSPTRTIATFTTGPVLLNLTFTTPVLPDDLAVMSRPLTYVTWEFRAVDGKPHEVAFQFDASAELGVDTREASVVWGREEADGLDVMCIGTKDKRVREEERDDSYIDRRFAYVAVANGEHAETRITTDVDARTSFAEKRAWAVADDSAMPRSVDDHGPVLAARFDLGAVTNAPVSRRLMLACDDESSIVWMGHKLRPYWRTKSKSARELLETAEKEWADISSRVQVFDAALRKDLVARGGLAYARIACLAYRQCLGGNQLVADANGRPLLFTKGNSSDGSIGAVDVIYPMSPLVLLLGPDLTKALLTPVLEYGSSAAWKFPFAPHELGTYPIANGQVRGRTEASTGDRMPVEDSSDMILLVAALAEVDSDASFARRYLPTLAKWAGYLEANGFDAEIPSRTNESTLDVAHDAALSAKAILALGAFSRLCAKLELPDEAVRFRKLAESWVECWTKAADDGDHTRLAFDQPGTWSQKPDLAWDRVLGLSLFPDALEGREMAWYRKAQGKYGLLLDSRATSTNLDSIAWTATITGSRDDFDALMKPIALYVDETPDRVPLCSGYHTTDARTVGVPATPVVGALFMWMIADRTTWTGWFGRGQSGTTPWAPMPSPAK